MTKHRRRTRDDYENPDAPPDERRLRADHPEIIDGSYTRIRPRQLLDLYKGALFDPGIFKVEGPDGESNWPTERLEVYLKDRARGAGYVCDFVYLSQDLPVTVYGIFIDRGRGLEIAELELFRLSWGYDHDNLGAGCIAWDDPEPDDDVDEPEAEDDVDDDPATLITADLLRRIPLGRIVAQAQQTLAQTDWRSEGVAVLMGPDRGPDELTDSELRILEGAVTAAGDTRRGRPELPDELLEQVARAYLDEAPAGTGLTRRLAQRFDRPEPTVRDWIASARRRGWLTPAVPGRRGAAPGPKLTART